MNKNKTTKLVSALLIVLMLLPSILLSLPNKGYAFWGVFDVSVDPNNLVPNTTTAAATTTTSTATFSLLGFKIKDVAIALGQELLKVAAKRLLAEMTQATVNWINSGFSGAPLFLENPSSFFQDIAESEIKNLVDIFGYDPSRFPFGQQFALNTISSYKSQLETNTQYTLSKVINDPALLQSYRTNFNTGGWNGFLVNTQYPQNNYIGFQMLATNELAKRLEGTVQTAAQKVQTTLQQGMGFLSPQTCPSNPAYNNGTNEFLKPTFHFDETSYAKLHPPQESDELDEGAAYNAEHDRQKAVEQKNWATVNTCPGGLVATTPGSVAANQIFSALNVPFLSSALDGAIGNAVGAIFDALLNKLIDTGLNALSSTVSPAPPKDNWSYNGQTLSGKTKSNNSAIADLNIPQNVSVTVGQTTSTIISGGQPSYSIQIPSNPTIATAIIDLSNSSGPRLKITAGTIPGTTSVTVKDSSSPTKTVTVTITVNAVGALVTIPASVSTSTNGPFTATISGGTEPYIMPIGPNESIAVAIVSGTNLIVTGIAKGNTSVVIQDSSTSPKTVNVIINIDAADNLVITPQNISVGIGQTSNATISGGTEPYILTSQPDITIASAGISSTTPNTLTVTGLTAGTTSVVIRDSSSPFKTVNIIITTLAPQGSCKIRLGNGFTISQKMDEASCASAEGRWTAD